MYPTYILGVPSNFRGEELIESLRDFGFEPNIVWGPQISVDDKLIAENTNQKFANFAINRDIKPQEVACCLGHIRMYLEFFESKEEWGLFLEDDAICLVNPKSFLEALPIVKEACHVFVHDGPGTNFNLMTSRHDSLGQLGMAKRLDPQYGAYGYLLNRAAVRLILESKVVSHINTPDWPYLWPHAIKFYQSKTVFFTHPKDMSMSIIGERINAESTIINQLPNPLRVLAGIKLGLSVREVLGKEITLKLLRLPLQILRKVGLAI